MAARLQLGCSYYAAIKYVCNNWWRQSSQLERLVACLQQPCSFYQRLQAAAVCSKQAATVCSKQAATKSEKSNLHTKNAQAARLQQTMSCKVAATKSSKTNLHTKNSQEAIVLQLAAAAKPHACCLFAAIHCEKPFISIRVHTKFGSDRHSSF